MNARLAIALPLLVLLASGALALVQKKIACPDAPMNACHIISLSLSLSLIL
jgi:hypothetical protein